MAGRKPQLNGATKNRIHKLLCEGDTMVTVARKIGVNKATIYKWMKNDKKLKDMVKEAREIQASTIMDECLTIADDASKDLLVDPETGREYPNTAAIARAKIQIDTRRKMSGYYHPTAFGEKTQLDVISSDGSAGFGGLMITPPKEIEEETDGE